MSQHLKTQIWRWARIAIMAASSTGLIGAFVHGTVSKAVLIPLLIATAEVIWRQVFPAVPAPWPAPSVPPPDK